LERVYLTGGKGFFDGYNQCPSKIKSFHMEAEYNDPMLCEKKEKRYSC
jgi:hypothetical protein